MISNKLLKSLGCDLKDVASEPSFQQFACYQRHHVLQNYNHQKRSKHEEDEEEEEEGDGYSTTTSNASSSTNTPQTPQIHVIEAEYSKGFQNQTKEYTEGLVQELEKLKLQQNPTPQQKFRIHQLSHQIRESQQIQFRPCEAPTILDNEECPHCGMVGTLKVDVHRCFQRCQVCNRESRVEYVNETIGSTLMITSPNRYSRREHFRDILKNIQAQRPIELPPKLIGHVLQYLIENHGVKTPQDIKYKWMKKALSKTGYAKKKKDGGNGNFRDHIMTIYCRLTHMKPPRFKIHQTKRLIYLFDRLLDVFDQAIYDLGYPRSNWLCYEFTIFKLCQKEGYTNMQGWFGILTGPKTLEIQDQIMEQMFKLLNWTGFQKTRHEETPKPAITPKITQLKSTKPEICDIIGMESFISQHESYLDLPSKKRNRETTIETNINDCKKRTKIL